MKRILITLGLTLGLLLLMMPMAVSASSGVAVINKTGDGKWIDVNTWEVEIYPSETKSTTLTLYNSSSSSLEVEVTPPNPMDNGNLTFEFSESNFTMSGRSYMDVTLTLSASGSATPGIYTAELLEIKSEVPRSRSSGGSRPRVIPTPDKETEPDVVEPEEPEIVEPTASKPEPEEPIGITEPEEPTEPEKPVEPEEPTDPTEPDEEKELGALILTEEPSQWNWLNIILAILVVGLLGLDIWQWRRRKQRD